MLTQHDTHLWRVQHHFKVRGLAISSHMTVVRLRGDLLWLHSPVPMCRDLQDELRALGEVRWLVAPSRAHDLFLRQASEAFPTADIWLAPGMVGAATVPSAARALDAASLAQWRPDLDGALIQGMPKVNETLWFHTPSSTLIVTDWLQWWRGPLPWGTRLWAHAMGVRNSPGVSRLFGHFVQEQDAYRQSLAVLSDWPLRRVLMCHGCAVDWGTPEQARADVGQALGQPLAVHVFGREQG